MKRESYLKDFKIQLQLFADDPAGDPPAAPEGDPPVNPEGDPPVTYSQEDIEAMKAQWEKEQQEKINQAKKDAATEAERLAKLTDEERLKEQLKNLEEENNQYKSKEAERQLRDEAVKCLEAENLPTNFVEFVLGKDAETTKANITVVKEAYNQAVQKAVEARLAGDTPKGGGDTTTEDDTAEQFKKALKGGY